jgi:hypothetical protein
MEITLDIPNYEQDDGMKFNWLAGFDIEVKYMDNTIILIANKEGLTSLANHFLNLAQDKIPIGYHFHLDEINALEKGSIELIVQKK